MPSLKNKRKPGLRGKSKKTSLRKTKKSMNKKTSRRGRRVQAGGMNAEEIKSYIEKWFNRTLTRNESTIRRKIKEVNETLEKLGIDELLTDELFKAKIVEFTLNDSNQTINNSNREDFFLEAFKWYLNDNPCITQFYEMIKIKTNNSNLDKNDYYRTAEDSFQENSENLYDIKYVIEGLFDGMYGYADFKNDIRSLTGDNEKKHTFQNQFDTFLERLKYK